jgi:hypothetical protein
MDMDMDMDTATAKIGDQFNLWTIIRAGPVTTGKWPAKTWFCRCRCGSESFVTDKNIRYGKSKGCVKCRSRKHHTNAKELVGSVFGNWQVLTCEGANQHQCLIFKCRCACGHIKLIEGSKLRKDRYPLCAKCLPVIRASSAVRLVWKKINWCAKARGLCIEVGWDYLEELFKLPKTVKEAQNGATTASLDRIDSAKGYLNGNVQWIHKDLNRMKQEFSDEKFLDWCRRVVQHAVVKAA